LLLADLLRTTFGFSAARDRAKFGFVADPLSTLAAGIQINRQRRDDPVWDRNGAHDAQTTRGVYAYNPAPSLAEQLKSSLPVYRF
jgi:hypothetical protein